MSPEGPPLGRMAMVSLTLHILLFLVLTGSSLFKSRRFITPNPYFVDLVTAPAPREPARTKKPAARKAPPPPPKPEKKPKEPETSKEPEKVPALPKPQTEGLKPVENTPPKETVPDVTREIERLRAVERLRQLQSLRSVVDARRESDATSPAVSGDAENSNRAHVYYGVVTHRVWEHWTYAGNPEPAWETLVYIQLDGDGALLDQRIESGSGNEEFDRSVLRALAKAAPFPPPPEGIDRQIVFRFRP